MSARTIRLFDSVLRTAGGATITEFVALPSGEKVPAYRSIPIFRNDYIPENVTEGTSTNTSYIFAGTFDEGSRSQGIAGLTAETLAGIQVVDVGEMEAKDNHKWRVKWYCGLALFSQKGLAMATGIKKTVS